MRVAVIHDWLNGMRGGEKVLEAILEMYPEAEVFTLFVQREKLSPFLRKFPIHVSWLQYVPFGISHYRHFLPLLPFFVRTLNVSEFDLVISSSHCVAKGVRKGPHAKHITYIHAPMRYMWERFEDYFGKGQAGRITRLVAKVIQPFLRAWDRRVTQKDRVDLLVTNSKFIGNQCARFYHRDFQVIHPFVDAARFNAPRNVKDYYLLFGAFAPYKKIDLAVRAFKGFGRKLVVAGNGQDLEKLLELCGESENITYIQSPSDSEVTRLYSEAKAFIFPGIEDFGITPLEAMASGCPVIAMGEGGALETVTDETGVFFTIQNEKGLRDAVISFEKRESSFNEAAIRAHAATFSKEKFQKELKLVVAKTLN
jgi:glycosyltransferase involved in cell wall biosynthesis